MPKPKSGESKSDFIDRCMGSAEANDDFPDNDQRFAFCNSVWEDSRNVSKTMNHALILFSTRLNGPPQTKQLAGREYLVVPAVLVQSQVLENNLGATFLPAEVFTAEWAEQWNGVPVVVHDHPSVRGIPVSARDPEILNTMGVGTVYHAQAEIDDNGNARIKAEVWLEVARAQEVPELQTIFDMLNRGELVELSTGFPTAVEEVAGTHNGRSYDMVLHPNGADHLAIFDDKIGACSVADGCGLGVFEKVPEEDIVAETKPDQKEEALGIIKTILSWVPGITVASGTGGTDTQPPVVDTPPDTKTGPECRALLRRLKLAEMTNCDIGSAIGQSASVISQMERGTIQDPDAEVLNKLKTFVAEKFADNQEQSDEERRAAVMRALDERFGGSDRFLWIEAMFSDQKKVVFGVVHETLDGRMEDLFQAEFTLGDNEEVTFSDPEKVVMRTVFEPAENQKQKESENMKKDELIAQLAENGSLSKEELAKLNEKQLEALAGVETPAEPAGTGADTPPAEPAQPAASAQAGNSAGTGKDSDPEPTEQQKKDQATITNLLEEVARLKEITAPAVNEQERKRKALIAELAANEQVPFDEKELEAKSINELEKLHKMSRPVTYAGRGGPTQGMNMAADEYAEPVPYWQKDKQAADKKE